MKKRTSAGLYHFFAVLSIDIILLLSTELTFFTSIYIKEADFYMSQKEFMSIVYGILILYNIVSSCFLDCENMDTYFQDCIIPLGVPCVVVLIQYWFWTGLLFSVLAAISVILVWTYNRKNTSTVVRKYAMSVSSVIVLAALLLTLYVPKTIRVSNKGENLPHNMSIFNQAITENKWKCLSTEEKLEHLQNIVSFECEKLGCDSIPICANSMTESANYYTAAHYDWIKSEITVNFKVLKESTYKEAFRTVIHEVRHHYQHQVVNSLDESIIKNSKLAYFKTAQEWYASMRNYKTFKNNDDEYFYQAIEEDAEKYADEEIKLVLSP